MEPIQSRRGNPSRGRLHRERRTWQIAIAEEQSGGRPTGLLAVLPHTAAPLPRESPPPPQLPRHLPPRKEVAEEEVIAFF
ncbi:hypothetical protein BRADI_2g26756v3 [Brachypodium distachyon]|uniref:Uncharacterized protein n=1 Tax=Brachypodium distachyon TaxID=15368 RepID=A0A2K2DAS5_BRADI|nr:hypothetical protein BRADI_2g26756v3 [Brachypodium distachyon]